MKDSRLQQNFSEQERSSLHSRSSHGSDDSLAALELLASVAPTAHHRTRSFSGSSFGFERDLLPLSASLSESDEVRSASGEKTIGLINGVALVAGAQGGSGHFFVSNGGVNSLLDRVRNFLITRGGHCKHWERRRQSHRVVVVWFVGLDGCK